MRYYKFIGLLLFGVFVHGTGLTQHKTVDAPIPKEEFNRIERVRKLFNQYHIYEGERILKGYIKEHPTNPYYREALVQLEQQVLNRIKKANDVLEEISPQEGDFWDSWGSTEEKLARWNGLVRDSSYTVKGDRGRANKSGKENSSLSEEWVEGSGDEELEGENLFVGPKQKAKMRKRQLKLLTDLSQLPFGAYKMDLIQHARLATLLVRGADTCSHLLRYYLVDTIVVDPVMTELDVDKMNDAVQALYANLPGDALVKLNELVAEYPDAYTLYMHIGQAQYLLGNDTAALKTYIMASALQPTRPDPFVERAKIFYEKGHYIDAGAEMILALNRYPEENYKTWLRRIADRSGKAMLDPWVQREVYPMMPQDLWQDRVAKPESPWFYYQAAKQEVVKYCDSNGVLMPNDSTKFSYLEMYCWKRMLDSADEHAFPFARLMMELGYLDCYVLVTEFHHDLFPQYKAFMQVNEEKVKKYYHLLINWNDKRFEKYRKRLAILSGEKKVRKKKRKR